MGAGSSSAATVVPLFSKKTWEYEDEYDESSAVLALGHESSPEGSFVMIVVLCCNVTGGRWRPNRMEL